MWIFSLVAIFIFAFYFLKKHKNYFKDRNVPYVKPNLILGNLSDAFLMKKGIYENFLDLYNHPDVKNEPFFGIFLLHKPTIVLKDPELIKRICVKDFNSFSNHYIATGRNDPFSENVFLVHNPKWKHLRQNISKFFSSGRMKAAFPLIQEKGSKLSKYLNDKLDDNGKTKIVLKEVSQLFTMDVIGSLVFGIDAHSLDGVKGEFQDATQSMFDYSLIRALELNASFLLPSIMKLTDGRFLGEKYTNFMVKFLPEILGERKRNGIVRNDFLDLVLELKKDKTCELSEHDLLTQAMVFTSAGYESSSTTASFALYELTKNKKIQQRLRDEIKNSLLKNGGKITYEALAFPSEMPYLHQVVHETLRMYSILPYADRVCEAKDGYSLEPFSDFKIPYGMPVLIPIYAMGRDEKYFHEPLKFDPDRFESMNDTADVHLPFGMGPRICIGERLGLINMKMVIVKILSKFRLEMNEKTPREINLLKKAFIIAADKPLNVTLVRDAL